jgi:hypothetical protein
VRAYNSNYVPGDWSIIWSFTTETGAVQNDFGSGVDAGDSIDTALTISPGSGTGYLDVTDPADWYKVGVSSNQTVFVTMTPPSGADFDLYLFDTDRSRIGSSTTGGSATETVSGVASKLGYFYICVKRYNGSGIYSLAISVSAPNTIAESPHPYPNNFDYTWTVTSPQQEIGGLVQTRLHFKVLETEDGWDYVYVYDENYNLAESYTGSRRDFWTPWVTGAIVRIRLITDSNTTAYGFVIDNMETRAISPPPTPPSRRYAVIVGINDYQNANISDLRFAVNDATAWKRYLEERGYEIYAFLTDSQATERNIRDAIREASKLASDGGTLALIFSGHGLDYSPGGGGCAFCAYDVGYNSPEGWLTASELKDDLSNYRGRLFVFFDSCHSGGMGTVVDWSGANKPKRYMTTTCTAGGYGYEVPSYGHGAWTYWYLVQALMNHNFTAAEQAFEWAVARYPRGDGDTPQQFDGDPSTYFYICEAK